ncbi:glutamine synthetase family protein [Rhodohalobacter sp. 8-1]|uniref:glutamine synthetase family protein n=1 Tax=Rhodohalobacter sp. 8-1 TaxID=3131972 RepID=UPI0030ECA573
MDTLEIIKTIEKYTGSHIKFGVIDIDGVLRGKMISKKKFLKSVDKDIGFCNVIFGWDVNDQVYDDSKVTGWHTGFPDSSAAIDLSTYRTIPWNDNIPLFLADFHQSDDLSVVCPRSLLKRIGDRCRNAGYIPKFASEYEWFNFRETPQSLKQKGMVDPEPLTPGMFGYSLLRSSQYHDFMSGIAGQLESFGVPVEGIHTETGDGVYEACIEYSDLIEAADRSMLFKSGVKEIAFQHDIVASFMAKWSDDLPGCGGHVHQSLWNSDESDNLFFSSGPGNDLPPILEHYIAGQLHCLPDILPMYAPTVNSYKRFVSGSWASTSVSWGRSNRTTALRVIPGGEESARLETRVPGADANPYLSMAASLASGLYGIENKLTLDIFETQGNEYQNPKSQSLPANLKDAASRMKLSELAKELFGDAFVEHFVYTREWEWEQFSKRVTDWELKRYFEII